MAEERNDMPTIEEVKAKYADQFLKLPAVVSVGIGHGPDGGKVIVIGLKEEQAEIEDELPGKIEGYPVRVEIIGVPRAR